MIKKKRKLMSALLAAALILAATAVCCSAGTPSRPEMGTVLDLEGLLSAESVSAIEEANNALEKKNGCLLYVLTVEDTSGLEIREYASYLYERWQLPENAALLIVSSAKADYYLLVGAGASGMLGTQDIKDVLYSSLEVNFAEGNYDQAVLSCARTVISKLEAVPGETESNGFLKALFSLILVVIALAIIGIAVIMAIRARNIRRARRRRQIRRASSSGSKLPPRTPRKY